MKSLILKTIGLAAVLATGMLMAIAPVYAGGLDVYLSKPKDGISPYSDTTVETFSSLTAGTTYTSDFVSSIGTYKLSNTAKMKIVADGIYGAGTGNYMAFGAQTGTSAPITLQLNSAQSYFGFTWCAGDKNNGLSFYNGNQLVGYYSTASILSKLSQSTVTSIDGATYNSSSYFGQPVTGQNNTQPYGFINFIASGGATFDRIVFDNSALTSTGFESDNHTIRSSAPGADGSFVPVGSTSSAVPESGSLILLGLGGATAAAGLIRRRISVKN